MYLKFLDVINDEDTLNKIKFIDLSETESDINYIEISLSNFEEWETFDKNIIKYVQSRYL